MKRQPLLYRLNVTGACLVIFSCVRARLPPIIEKITGDAFAPMLAGYCLVLCLSCLLPVIFIENMCDFHPTPLKRRENSMKAPRFAIVPAGMLMFVGLSLVNALILMPLQGLGIYIPTGGVLRETSGVFNLLFYFFYIAALPALVEEIFVRGVVLPLFREDGDRFAVVFSAFIFASMHTRIGDFLPLFGAGAILACIYLYTGNIYICMTLHFVNNAYSFLVMYAGSRLGGVYPAVMAAFLIFFILAGGIAAAIYLYKKRYNFLSPLFHRGKSAGLGEIFKSPVMIIGLSLCFFASFSRLYDRLAAG